MNLLIVRTSALGDIVHCLPALTALRRRFPEARIGWIVERAMAPLLDGHPDVDELLIVGLRPWRKAPLSATTRREFAEFRRQLAAFRADVALDLMGNHKAGVLTRMSRAPRRIGLRRRDRREPSSALWINEPVRRTGPHAVDAALAVVGALDAALEPVELSGARLAEREPRVRPKAPYALLFPATAQEEKNYPPDRFGALAADLAQRTDLHLYLAPGPGEEEVAGEIATASSGAAEVLPVVPIPELVALLRGARLAIGGDTGPIHLAHAVGTPVLCFMGPTDPAQSGPYGAQGAVVVAEAACSACSQRRGNRPPCLHEIAPKRLVDQALALLEGS